VWDLPVNPATGSIAVTKNGGTVASASGLAMKDVAGGWYAAEAAQSGIIDWDSNASGPSDLYSDEAYDSVNTVTCTPSPTGTTTPTHTPTITPTNTITPTVTPTPSITPTPGGPTPTITRTPTPHGTRAVLDKGNDSFLCECDCEDTSGTPTPTTTPIATATPEGDWFACWETGNEEWNPEYDNFGDWDGRGIINARTGGGGVYPSYISSINTAGSPSEGTYCYEHEGNAPDSICDACTWIECSEEKTSGWFSGKVKWAAIPGIGASSYTFWSAGETLSSVWNKILYLETDSTDGNKVKLKCAANNSCDVAESWVCSDTAPTPGEWYEYIVYWDLPFDTPNGRVDCWWGPAGAPVQTVHDGTVQTETTALFNGYKYIQSGIINWLYPTCSPGNLLFTDDLWDCGCKIVGAVTPTPWPTPTP